jgi:hypothetical protein
VGAGGLELEEHGQGKSHLMGTRATRREHNQLAFRKANEGFHDVVEDRVQEGQRIPFLCECAANDCFAKVEATLAEWESVAEQHNRFLMIAGHQHSEGEEVVGSLREYEVAEKPD